MKKRAISWRQLRDRCRWRDTGFVGEWAGCMEADPIGHGDTRCLPKNCPIWKRLPEVEDE